MPTLRQLATDLDHYLASRSGALSVGFSAGVFFSLALAAYTANSFLNSSASETFCTEAFIRAYERQLIEETEAGEAETTIPTMQTDRAPARSAARTAARTGLQAEGQP